MRLLIATALAVSAIAIAKRAVAEPERKTIAGGIASVAIPESWVEKTRPGRELDIELKTSEDDLPRMVSCTVSNTPSPWSPALTQEVANAQTLLKTTDLLPKSERKVVSFSTAKVIDGVRVIDIVSRIDQSVEFRGRTMPIVGSNSASVLAMTCATDLVGNHPGLEKDQKLLREFEASKAKSDRDIEDFLNSVRITPR